MDDLVPPNITIPLPLFLDILWGYKKGVELRERAVPGNEIIAILSKIPQIEKYIYIQSNPEGLDIVWQLDEWKKSGEKQESLRQKTSELWDNIETVIQFLEPAFGILGREALRTLASDLVTNKKWNELRGMGVDISKLKGINE